MSEATTTIRRTAFRSGFQWFVEQFMAQAGQDIPEHPTMPDEATRLLRARLIAEEAFETIERGLGVSIVVRDANGAPMTVLDFDRLDFQIAGPGDLVELADGCADVAVVTCGTMSAAGIPDRPFLHEVMANNMAKLSKSTRDEHGKLVKPANHKPPRIAENLALFSEAE